MIQAEAAQAIAVAKRFEKSYIAPQPKYKSMIYIEPSELLSNRPTLVNVFNHDGPTTSLTLCVGNSHHKAGRRGIEGESSIDDMA